MKCPLPVSIEPFELRRLLASSYIDPEFGTVGGDGPYLPGGSVSETVPLSNGSTLFATTNTSGFTLGRMLSDGRTLDSGFNSTGYKTVSTTSQPSVNELLQLANGDTRALVNFGGIARIYAFTQSGAIDTTFGNAGSAAIEVPGRYAFASGIAFAPGGGFYVAGVVGNGSVFNSADSLMARVTATGQIDATFGGGIQVVNRGIDPSFSNYDRFSDVVVLPDGRPIGFGTYHYSFNRAKLGRFNLDGSFDTAWPTATNGGNVDNIGGSGEMKLDANGKIFIAVDATTSSGTSLIRMRTTDGALDTIYGSGGFSYPERSNLTFEQMTNHFALKSDGSAYILANYRASSAASYSLITALTPAGTANQDFGSLGIYKVVPSEFSGGLGALVDIDFLDDGRLVVAGRGDSTGSFLDRILVQDTTNAFTTVTGRVFIDSNGNALKDADEQYFRILVFEDENGNNNHDEFERAVLSSATTGEFTITHLAAGDHRVRLLSLFYYVYTVGSAEGYLFNTASPGSVLSGFDFALRPQNGINGYIYDDLDLDGIQDGNESLLSGARVYLDLNRNGIFDSDEPNAVTNATDLYTILDVPTGPTWIGLELPPGYESLQSTLAPYQYNIQATGVASLSFGAFRPATVAPKVLRSFIDLHTGPAAYIEFAFSEDVSASLGVNDFLVRNTTTNAYLSDSFKRMELVPWGNKTYARLWFEPYLPDGRYELTLSTASILDVDNRPVSAITPLQFQYLEGDLTSDGVVNFNDVLALVQRYGMTGKNHLQGNLNRDPEGLVDFADLLILVQVYRHALSTAAIPGTLGKRASVSTEVLGLQ